MEQSYICALEDLFRFITVGIVRERFWNALGAGKEPGTCIIASRNGAKPLQNLEVMIMYFDSIAKIIAERTGCDISAVKPESGQHRANMRFPFC